MKGKTHMVVGVGMATLFTLIAHYEINILPHLT